MPLTLSPCCSLLRVGWLHHAMIACPLINSFPGLPKGSLRPSIKFSTMLSMYLAVLVMGRVAGCQTAASMLCFVTPAPAIGLHHACFPQIPSPCPHSGAIPSGRLQACLVCLPVHPASPLETAATPVPHFRSRHRLAIGARKSGKGCRIIVDLRKAS